MMGKMKEVAYPFGMNNTDPVMIATLNITDITSIFSNEPYPNSDFQLICPYCGDDYQHITNSEWVNGEDDYKAWSGRGDAVYIKISGECGSEWGIRIGFHKGNSFLNIYGWVSCKFVEVLNSPIEKKFWYDARGFIDGLLPQYSIGPYRVDFAIPAKKAVIELDGHEYHKTKEQRTNDAKRERYLTAEGWTVIRFTGSEVYNDVAKCVDEVATILKKL